jgi:predicted RNA-binding Zn-ribbon protein involved in translation (DUF1610 family)
MERLMFVCPATGEKVDAGFECEIGTLLRIRMDNVRAPCPACGEQHEWPIRDACLNEPPAIARS